MRSRSRLLVIVGIAAAAVIAVVLLRGGDDAGGVEVTHAQLVERANAICARLARDNAALEAPPKPYDQQSAAFFTSVGDNAQIARDALAELDPPSADAGELDRIVDLYDRIDTDMEQLQSAAAVEQVEEIELKIAEIGEVTREVAVSERALGICPGKTSAQVSIGAQLRRSRPNPLTETGQLDQ